MLKSANLGLNIFEGQDNVKRISFVENFELLDREYGNLVKNNSEYVRTTGNANTYIASKDGVTSYYEGLCLKIKIHVDSTGNCTLNLNGLGAKYIRDSYGNIVTNLKKDIPYHVCYNGSDFILLGKGGGGNAQPNHVLENYTFTNDSGPQIGTLKNNGTKIFTPGRSNIALSGYYADGSYIKGDPNLISANIPEGITMFGVSGTFKSNPSYNDLSVLLTCQYRHGTTGEKTYGSIDKYNTNEKIDFRNVKIVEIYYGWSNDHRYIYVAGIARASNNEKSALIGDYTLPVENDSDGNLIIRCDILNSSLQSFGNYATNNGSYGQGWIRVYYVND